MNLVTYNISLDVHKTSTQAFISAIRGDTSRVVVASLSENGRPYDIAEGCTAVFTAVKPDGKFIYNDCEIDTEKNTITYKLTSQTTAVSGEVKCQFKLIGNDGSVLGIPGFSIIVGDTLYNEEPIVESSEEFHALTAYIAKLQQMLANGEFKGEPGVQGPQGEKGETGATGAPGKDGADGRDADPNLYANALKGTASGASVYVDDVSPLDHDAKIKLTSDSITDFSSAKVVITSEQVDSVNRASDAKSGLYYTEISYANGNHRLLMDDVLAEASAQDSKYIFYPSNWDKYKEVVINSNSYVRILYLNSDNESAEPIYRDVPVDFYWAHESAEDGENDRLILSDYETPEVEGYYASSGELYVKDLTVELVAEGNEAPAEAIIVTPDADGTVPNVKSLCPSMAVATDADGAVVELEYNKDISDSIKDIENLAKGAVGGKTFWSYEQLITELNSADNTAYYQGQHMLIKTLNVPDVWVYDVAETSEPYTYVDDASFAEAVNGAVVQVGYYVLSALETQKVNLDEYVKKTDYATATTAGLVKVHGGYGMSISGAGIIYPVVATEKEIAAKTNRYNSITPQNIDYAVKVGLTTNTETLTDEEKSAALAWLGANDAFSNALKCSKSGEVIRIDDVSPIEHTVKTKVKSKNRLNADGMVNASFVKNDDGSFTVTKSSSSRFSNWADISIPANTYFSLSATNIEGTAASFAFQVKCKDGSYLSLGPFSPTELSYSNACLSSEVEAVRVFVSETEADGAYLNISGLQIELGGATEYVPFVDISTVALTRCGKNQIRSEIIPNEQWPYAPQRSESGVTWTTSETREITVEGETPEGQFSVFPIASSERLTGWLVDGETYVASLNKSGTGDIRLFIDVIDKESGNVVLYVSEGTAFTVDKSKYTYGTLRLQVAPGNAVNAMVKPQIELGSTATEYEAYKSETYTPNVDGTLEFPSLSPTMTLFADTNGVNIDITYNADTKKYIDNKFAEMQAAIISLGGNL